VSTSSSEGTSTRLIFCRYVLFSIGNVRPLLQAAFPQCWSSFKICNEIWTQAVDYLEICGIIVGEQNKYRTRKPHTNAVQAKSSLVSLVTGWVVATVSSRMPSSCLSVFSCLPPPGE
jgi:hypothetical protein